MFGETLNEEHCLFRVDAKKVPSFNARKLRVNSLPATSGLNADKSRELGINGGVAEVHIEQRLHQVGRHPDVVDGKRRTVHQTQATKMKELLLAI